MRRTTIVAKQHDTFAHRDDGIELPAFDFYGPLEIEPVEEERSVAHASLVGHAVFIDTAPQARQDAIANTRIELVQGKRRIRCQPTDDVGIADQAHVRRCSVETESLQVVDRRSVRLDVLELTSCGLEVGELGTDGGAGVGQQAAGGAAAKGCGRGQQEDEQDAVQHVSSVMADRPRTLDRYQEADRPRQRPSQAQRLRQINPRRRSSRDP